VIELSLEDLARQLDLDRPDDVPAALRLAGVAARPLVRGGRIQAMAMEHTWVAALVPYSNYRGAAVDFSGMTWVPLAPALKGYASERGRFVLRELDPEVTERVDQYLSRAQHVDPLAQVQGEVEALLDGEGRGETVDDVLGTRSVDAAPLGLLPSSLPATVLAVTGESATLAPEHVQRIRLRVWPGGTGEADGGQAPLLDAELTLGELLARRVSLSFMPATLEDHQTTLLFGGLLSTPPYLVEVRPQLVVAGRREAAGDGSLADGRTGTSRGRVAGA
jgi:hypothetical protein